VSILLEQQPPVKGVEGSFAAFTIRERLPSILDQLIEQGQFKDRKLEQLLALKQNVKSGEIQYLPKTGPDQLSWKSKIEPHMGKSWFDVPFYFLEAYFYRMILDYVDYYENGLDPFFEIKKRDVEVNIQQMHALAKAIDWKNGLAQRDFVGELIKVELWGNKADLSQLQIDRALSADEFTIHDDTSTVAHYLEKGVKRVDIILDNSGVELFTDILMAVRLLKRSYTKQVMLHTKAYPTFVSDATSADVVFLQNQLTDERDQATNDVLQLFRKYRKSGQLKISSDPFWNAPLHFYQMPKVLSASLAKSDLLIFKGDANYRRIFGDRIIPTGREQINLSQYLPAKSLAIRILKSEIMVGLSNEIYQSMQKRDKDWLLNGRYGIIQLLN